MSQYTSKNEVLTALNKGEIGVDQAAKLLEQFQPTRNRGFSLKVSEKGCVSIWGKGLPWRGVHIYPQGVQTILDHSEDILEFIEANRDTLSFRQDKA